MLRAKQGQIYMPYIYIYMQVIHTYIYIIYIPFDVMYIFCYASLVHAFLHQHMYACICMHAHTVLRNTPRNYKKLASSDTNNTNSTEYQTEMMYSLYTE